MTEDNSASQFQFVKTDDPGIIKELYTLCGSEWSGQLTPEQFGEIMQQDHLEYVDKNKDKLLTFVIQDTSKNNKVVACACVRIVDGFYKPGDKSPTISSVPDPNLFGVKNVTVLLIAYVFTHKDYRKNGLAQKCVSGAIEHTENLIIQQAITRSDETKPDNFKRLVLDDNGDVDTSLANDYLSKEYFWMLYSGVQTYYERFGFKAYPLDFYELPLTNPLSEGQEAIVKQLIQNEQHASAKSLGKELKLIRGDNEADQELIKFMLQTRELEMVTELNKLNYHLELETPHKSATSLTNLTDLLVLSKSTSATPLSCALEENSPNTPPAAHTQSISKLALKPSYDTFRWNVLLEQYSAKKLHADIPLVIEYTNIQGAILTNHHQSKSYYILWNTLMQRDLYILSMGEIEFENLNNPTMGSSLGGIVNELDGYNFQDLDILISLAVYVAKMRSVLNVYVSVNDLPENVPKTVMYDFFMKYYPNASSFSNENDKNSENSDNIKVKLVTDAITEMNFLPMLKLFGNNNSNFDLDWIDSGMLSWG